MRIRGARPGSNRGAELRPVLILLLGLAVTFPASADEGMWTFDNPPVKAIEENYGFAMGQEWLDHVRLAAVRFMDGGSGAFVSPEGLVVTNHHVAMGQLQKMSDEAKDYVADGFYAPTRPEEIRCADLELNVLVELVEVTGRVLGAVKEGMSGEESVKARDAVRAAIEKESLEATGLRSDVISLYRGGEYWLYRYRKYTDVRLVMAPEEQAAFFGGDHDNFTYPRYNLDFAFFRVYEDDKPLAVEHYLKWNPAGPAEGELVFIAGNPGRTSRLLTMAQLEYRRDRVYPRMLHYIDRSTDTLRVYAAGGEEQQRRAQVLLRGLANSRKAYGGMLAALRNEALMGQRRSAEAALKARVAEKPEHEAEFGGAWPAIEGVYREHAESIHRMSLQEMVSGRGAGTLIGIALTLARYLNETARPDGERLDGYHDSQLEERRFYLDSPAPIYRDLEAVLLEQTFHFLQDSLGPDDPVVKAILDVGDVPGKAARRLAGETGLVEVAPRQALLEGGLKALEKSEDPLIVLARKLEPLLRANEDWRKKHVESVLTPAAEQIARARFAIHGKSAYPDATFTLRFSYGRAEGYPMNGTLAPYKTTLYGMYGRALSFDQQGEFWLPERFWGRKDWLDLGTPVNFCSSLDTIGGNSGSPVINSRTELVGINFDRNIEGLSNAFLNDPVHNRNISVHAGCVDLALRSLYDAVALAEELAAAR